MEKVPFEIVQDAFMDLVYTFPDPFGVDRDRLSCVWEDTCTSLGWSVEEFDKVQLERFEAKFGSLPKISESNI